MTAEELAAEIQRHLWRITELKAELHDEQVAAAHLSAVQAAERAQPPEERRARSARSAP